MKRVFLAAASLLLTAVAFAGEEPRQRYLVATRASGAEAAQEIVESELPRRGFRAIAPYREIRGFAADLTASEAAALRRSPRVRYIEEDVTDRIFADVVSEGKQTTPYGVSMLNAPAVWGVTKGVGIDGRAPVRVVVIDTGIALNHPDIVRAYRGGINTLNTSAAPLDDNAHGTHVAGTIAAADDAAGVVGVAPDVEIYAAKVCDDCGSCSVSNQIAAIDWAIQKKQEIGGNWILNLSLGGPTRRALAEEAFKRATDAGILVFAASGNDGETTVSFPAAYPGVVAVGAIDQEKAIASFSNTGPEIKLVAPGVSVLSSIVGLRVRTSNGREYRANAGVAKDQDADDLCLPLPSLTGTTVFAGFGGVAADFPAEVQGNIALVERGNGVTFETKMKLAKAAGAVGVICFNDDRGMVTPSLGTYTSAGEIIPFVLIEREEGLLLKAAPSTTVTTDFGLLTYANFNGTSMATPHAAAAAALVWAAAPDATAEQVKNALINTATDLGAAGYDTIFGHGLVDVLAAAKSAAPARFGNPTQPPPSSTTPVPGRRSLKRG
ncbi:MAG TPA: S8 family serine peptidase [Thermoanaerobaculia bacterium]|nr:S8 family serine peptidase [Thermoanaerobaculia bacterium]